MEPDLVPATEAAQMLDISVPTLHRWVMAGKVVAAVKAPGLRGARMFRRSDIEKARTSCVNAGNRPYVNLGTAG